MENIIVDFLCKQMSTKYVVCYETNVSTQLFLKKSYSLSLGQSAQTVAQARRPHVARVTNFLFRHSGTP